MPNVKRFRLCVEDEVQRNGWNVSEIVVSPTLDGRLSCTGYAPSGDIVLICYSIHPTSSTPTIYPLIPADRWETSRKR